MDRFERIFRLHGLLANRRTPMPLKQIQTELECSDSTAQRCINDLRDYLDAPLVYDRKQNGWHYSRQPDDKPYQLPGLWFSAEELYGLLICRQLLKDISPGMLHEQINQLHDKITTLLTAQHRDRHDLGEAIEIRTTARRLKDDKQFKKTASALFHQRRITVEYTARSADGANTLRQVSPQKMIYYRDNWYLLAWCHLRDALRLFAVDKLQIIKTEQTAACRTDPTTLTEFLSSAYGIFSGPARDTAELIFKQPAARWVADEQWHPLQQGEWIDGDRYRLTLPFSDSRELVMDILKYGEDIEVLAPDFLRTQVARKIDAMQKIYNK